MDLRKIAEIFGLSDAKEVSRLRSGHINRTFCISCSSVRYILQSLNREIFAEPEKIMRNISRIEEAFCGEESIAIPQYLSAEGKNYAEIDGEIWRIYRYIEEQPQPENRDRTHGYAVGRFLKVVNSGVCKFETPMKLHNFGLELPMRNIHGDTKADNIIIGRKAAVIDFDTAMRGYICADYGDMIRSATAKRDDLQVVKDITEGFADGLEGLLTEQEISSLYRGIELIIEELAGRYSGGRENFPNKTDEECVVREKELVEQLRKVRKHQNEICSIIENAFE